MRLGDLEGVVDLINSYKTGSIAKSELLWSLSQEKTIDAVPVVRCEHCDKSSPSKWLGSGWRFCRNNSQHHRCDHFCSYGERAEYISADIQKQKYIEEDIGKDGEG